MLEALFFTLVIAGLVWYFLLRKEGKARQDDQSQLSKTQLKKQAKQSKDASSKDDNRNTGGDSHKNDEPTQSSIAAKKPKNKVDHPFFFKSFKKNESAIIDFDISKDNQHLVIASKDRIHVLYNIKKDSLVKFSTSRFEAHLDTIPQAISVSEQGKFISLALESKVAVFKVQEEKANLVREFSVSKEPIMGLMTLEEQDTLIAAGSGHQCVYFIHTLQGVPIKTVRSDVTEASGLKIDRQRDRMVYFSTATDIRVFAPQLTSKREFKEFSKEHSMGGHKNGVVTGCFNFKGTEFFSLSLDRTLKRWDLHIEGFQGTHVPCLNTWPIDQSLIHDSTVIEWVGSSKDGETETNYICLTHDSTLFFFGCSDSGINLIDKIEDSHLGEPITKMTYVGNEKDTTKGVLFTKSEKKLFSWKPKFG